jgi:methylated-DNA-[protein]-cysteine S-methyltransferase
MTTRHATVETPIGALTVTAHDDRITGVYFPHHWYPPTAEVLGDQVDAASDSLLADAMSQLREYLAGDRADFDLPITADGDEFQKAVWSHLDEIPYGETVTYGEIAEKLGDRALAQRVGQAVGHNPLSLIVPCHRVVGANGKLTGYAGGIRRKALLLELERPQPADALF